MYWSSDVCSSDRGMAFDRARPHHAWTRSPDPAYPMPASTLDFLAGGLLQFGWGELLLYLLVATQLTIFAVTLYLPRSQAHRGLDFHPALAHFFRSEERRVGKECVSTCISWGLPVH